MLIGAVQVTVTRPEPVDAVSPVGGVGGTAGAGCGVTARVTDAGDEPLRFCAVTDSCATVPLVRPDTVHASAPAVVQVWPLPSSTR